MTLVKTMFPLIVLTCASQGSWGQTQPTCPIPPTSVKANVRADVSFNSRTRLYTYSYTVANERSSPLDLRAFLIDSDEAPLNPKSPDKWIPADFMDLPETPKHILWSVILDAVVKPGQSLSGFSFQSSRAPGPIKYYVRARSEVPRVVPTEDDDEPMPDCPGFFYDAKALEGDVMGVTQGPLPPGQVAAEIRIYREELDQGKGRCGFEDGNEGVVHVTLLGSDQFNVSKVDVKSIAFGPAGAKPVQAKIIGGGDKGRRKNLLFKFAVKDLGLRCNIHHALFISGLIDGNKFVGGAEVNPAVCRPKSKPQPHHGPKKHHP